MTEITLNGLVTIVQTAGPTTILAVWLYFEIQERKRLQRLIESVFIPIMSRTHKLIHSMNRVMAGGSDDDDGGDAS